MRSEFVLWHHEAMSKPSNTDNADTDQKGGGIGSAIAQDVELTIEQAEEAAKKAAHAAAVALGLASDKESGGNSSEDSPGSADPKTPSPESKPKA
jgi:hypothetical protein